MTRGRAGAEAGFSLVEMLVAMTITLIISGAIYGLLAGGQNAFRREPELTDRQQNARVAMNLIMKDIANAGAGMPAFIQAFKQNLDGPAGAPNNVDGVATDELEILTNESGRDNESVCNNPGNSSNVRLIRGRVDFAADTPVMLIMDDGTWTYRNVQSTSNPNTGAGSCLAGNDHVNLQMNSGGDVSGMNTSGGTCKPSANGLGNAGGPGDCVTVGGVTTCGQSTTACPNYPSDGPPCCTVVSVAFSEVVHYRIRLDAANVPVLQRSSTNDGFGAFQTVATGIEDLQIEYAQASAPDTFVAGAPAVASNPATPTAADYQTLIVKARVTLTARAEGRDLAGATGATAATAKVRGKLTSVGAPRSTLIHLANASTGSEWR